MTQYEQLKTIIQKAVPSIMALEFGCDTDYGLFVGEDKENSEYHFVKQDKVGSEDNVFYLEDVAGVKILGRPIRLADVLVAISKTKEYILVSVAGKFHKRTGPKEYLELGDWKLLDDNLDHQSEETKQFLISLLGKF